MKITLQVRGMTCSHCENAIINNLKKIESIHNIRAIASKNLVTFEYLDAEIDLAPIKSSIEDSGYYISDKPQMTIHKSITTIAILLFLGYIILKYNNTISFDFLPNIRQNMGYSALFIAGLLTSVHCVAMCGGINISQCSKYKETGASMPSLLYNLGRITSYTLIGGVIGGIGSVISFSGQMRGYVTIIVSLLMILMAIRMLKLFHVQLPKIQLPHLVQGFLTKLLTKGPFFVGFANGFIPCGPLQSMQLYALGTGSVISGALSMFYFSVGTFPLMFGLGFISTLMNNKFSKNIMTYSALLIFILGLTMFSRGAALAGIILPFQYNGEVVQSTIVNTSLQEVSINLAANNYKPIQVKKGIPVRLIIHAEVEHMNGCNNPITIPSLAIEKTLIPGKNEILFTPEDTGKIAYTCWMGMISSFIEVVE